MIHRGEIYWVELDPTVGSEIKKTRPAVVVSNEQNNEHSTLVTVLPITSKADRVFEWEVAVHKGMGGLKDGGKIKTNQIRTIDKKRLKGNPMGPPLDEETMLLIDRALKIHLALE